MRRPLLAFLTGLPVATLGGLIGLGGAEFRLPLLSSLFGYPVRAAVPLNLAVSFVTLLVSLLICTRTTPPGDLAPHLDALLSLLAGSMLGASLGTGLAGRVSDRALEGTVFLLLLRDVRHKHATGTWGSTPPAHLRRVRLEAERLVEGPGLATTDLISLG